ncbi:MAG: MFS transporter [Polyangiales bacterium]
MNQHQTPSVAGTTERRLLVLVSAVQFVNILDFMVVMPLGPDFARELGIPLSHLGWIGGAYTGAASIAGLLSARFLDRFDRRAALGVTLVGLVIGTACGGLGTGLVSLMLARVLAGAFGGPASALVLSIVADVVPPARRGRALGFVMGAFSLATVLGLPAALELSRLGGWRMAFFAVAALGVVVGVATLMIMPPLRVHLDEARNEGLPLSPAPGEAGLFADGGASWLTLLATFCVMTAAFAIIPNISGYVQHNLHYPREHLGVLYLAGGGCSFVVMRLMGPLVDRTGAAFTALLGTVLFVGLLAAAFVAEWQLPAALIYLTFMSSMAVRNISLGALSSRVPLAHERARFMSLQSAVQHAASSLGAIGSAQLLHERADLSLEGMPRVASIAIALAMLLPWLLYLVERRLAVRDAALPAPVTAAITEEAPPAHASSDLGA